jgi:hypothetical protein
VVRGPADEANALLVTMQLLEIVITAFWGHKGALDRWLRRLSVGIKHASLFVIGSNLFRQWLVVSVILFLGVGIPVSWFIYLTHPHAYLDLFFDPYMFFRPYTTRTLVVWACIALTIALIAAPILLGGAAMGLFVGITLLFGVTIGIIVDVAIIGLAFIMLFVVPELGPLAMLLAVSTETSPPGMFRVLQLTFDQQLETDLTLMHSITYSHPEALDAIATMVASNIKSPAG